jgi:hypothetical protein
VGVAHDFIDDELAHNEEFSNVRGM